MSSAGPHASGDQHGRRGQRTGVSRRTAFYQGLQKVGRSLMLPIAVLPAAGILNRFGQPDMFGPDGLHWNKIAELFAAAGGTLFDNLGFLFAVGIAIGFAKKADGSTALAAVVAYLVFTKVLATYPIDGEPPNTGVLGGVVIGLVTAVVWQRFHRTKLVDWLGFFNGRRLVPIMMAFIALLLGVIFGLIWPTVGDWIDSFGSWLVGLGALGSGIYGLVNRLLIPIGMHQFINVFVWFQTGSFTKDNGKVAHGDINRFFAGDPTAGQFQTGMFPIMMYGLPAAALAIAHCARPERRKEVTGMMLSVGLTSFVTGITEPIEFSFMFIAPVLYVTHAVLTGASMALTWALGIKDGFSFSAGLIDYALNWHLATRPWELIPIGLCFAVLYYAVFRLIITKMNLPTPGREPEEDVPNVTKA